MTTTIENLSLRLDGCLIPSVCIEVGIEDGYPIGPKGLVIDDPLLGRMTVPEDCLIEVQWGSGPRVLRTVQEVIQLLENAAGVND